MKAWLILGLCAVVAMGIVATQSDAAIELVVKVEFADGNFTNLMKVDSTTTEVPLLIWGYLSSMNGSYADDGIFSVRGGLISADPNASGPSSSWSVRTDTSTLLKGDLSFTGDADFHVFGTPSDGTGQDLDGDGDIDIGGKNHQSQGGVDGNWIYLLYNSGQWKTPDEANRVLLGTAVFMPDAGVGQADCNTLVRWIWTRKVGSGSTINSYKMDGNTTGKAVAGTSALLGADSGLVIQFVPEPMTLALLAAGGTALLAFRRRRKAT